MAVGRVRRCVRGALIFPPAKDAPRVGRRSARDMAEGRPGCGLDGSCSEMMAVAPSRAIPSEKPANEDGARLTYVLVIDADRRAQVDALIYQIPGASFYTIRSDRIRPGALPAGPLSPRLEQVLGLIGQGMSNKCIGRALGISHFTVRNHVARLLRLYDARNRDELVAVMQPSRRV